jgi:hypothetical protein
MATLLKEVRVYEMREVEVPEGPRLALIAPYASKVIIPSRQVQWRKPCQDRRKNE